MITLWASGTASYFAKSKAENLTSKIQGHPLLCWTVLLCKVNPKITGMIGATLATLAVAKGTENTGASVVGGLAGALLHEINQKIEEKKNSFEDF